MTVDGTETVTSRTCGWCRLRALVYGLMVVLAVSSLYLLGTFDEDQDRSGASFARQDGVAPRATALAVYPSMRGMALGMHAGEPDYDYAPALREIAKLNAGAVELLIPYFQRDVRSSQPGARTNRTPPLNEIARAIRDARANGLDVYLLPIVLLEDAEEKAWRGVIDPFDSDLWWHHYREIIVDLARIAEAEGASGLSVGSELVWSEGMRDRWKDVIGAVRREFRGQLLYSANWDHYEPVAFWDLLDAVGISSYFELTRDRDAPARELEEAWLRERERIIKFIDAIDRPLIFTEIGYPVVDGGAVYPWNYTLDGEPDEQEQAAALSAFIRAWDGDSRLLGAFIYEWNLPDRSLGNYSPRGRLAETVVAEWISAENVDP